MKRKNALYITGKEYHDFLHIANFKPFRYYTRMQKPSFLLVKISRPRFWIYLLGPYLLGWTAAASLGTVTASGWLPFILGLAFFSFPANLFIYGINDLHDAETDRLNPKKQGYEQTLDPGSHSELTRSFPIIVVLGLVFLGLIWFTQTRFQGLEATIGLVGCLLLAWQYSAPPIRAKARPFVDSLFNGLYVFPAFVGHALANGTSDFPNVFLLIAGWSWCVAMHAFSAIPDIEADTQAGLRTVATSLKKKKTLIFCGFLYAVAGVLAFSVPPLKPIALIATPVYLLLLAFAWNTKTENQLLRVYSWFPWVNAGVGFALWAALISPFN